jgi:uncharacterized protein YjiS (DUF1127 family)
MAAMPRISRDAWRRQLGDLIALVNEWRRRARSRRELAAMSDRELRDFGATHYDARYETRKPFWRA